MIFLIKHLAIPPSLHTCPDYSIEFILNLLSFLWLAEFYHNWLCWKIQIVASKFYWRKLCWETLSSFSALLVLHKDRILFIPKTCRQFFCYNFLLSCTKTNTGHRDMYGILLNGVWKTILTFRWLFMPLRQKLFESLPSSLCIGI